MAKLIHIAALDDEPLALEVLKVYCRESPEIGTLSAFTQPARFLEFCSTNPVDVLILDIQMPTVNGMRLYVENRFTQPVIFTTSFSDYAVEAFNIEAVDYILKPYSFERFQQSISRLKKALSSNEKVAALKVRLDYEDVYVPQEEVIYIKAWGDYLRIFLSNGKRLVTRSSMKEVELQLSARHFIRTHRSYIVSINYIRKRSTSSIEMSDGTQIPIGRKYKELISTKL